MVRVFSESFKDFCVQTGGKSRIACLCVERHAVNCASASKSGEMFIPPASTGKMFILPASTGKMFIPHETWLPAANYALARNATFSTNLDTKRRVYLERHGSDVTRVNTALATFGRVHFALVTIATMPPLVHNLLFFLSFMSWLYVRRATAQPPILFSLVRSVKYYTTSSYECFLG